MENIDRLAIGMGFFGLAFAMIPLGLDLLKDMGVTFNYRAIFLLFLVVFLVMIVFFVLGAIIILRIKKKKASSQKVGKSLKKNEFTLNDFLSEKANHFVALGLFLLITFTIPFGVGFLNKVMAILSAGVSYFVLLDLSFTKNRSYSMSLGIVQAFLDIFLITFPIWVILNLILPITQPTDYIGLVFWIVLILVSGISRIRNA